MKLRGLIGASVALGICWSSAAAAQEQVWLKDRRYTEGMGYRTGDLEVHPGLAGEFGYDSNPFINSGRLNNGSLGDAGKSNEPVISALRFRITPSLSIATLGAQRKEGGGQGEPPKVQFRAGIAATYNEYIATDSAFSDQVSKQRNVGGVGSLSLTILPSKPVGGDIYGSFARSLQPSPDTQFNFNRNTGALGAGISWNPGGGMFDWRFGYEYGFVLMDKEAFKIFDNTQHQINTRGGWRFLPRTALRYDASIGFLRYRQSDNVQHDSDPVRARLGINGLITQSFAMLAMAGWGASFYKDRVLGTGTLPAHNFDGLIAQAELKWFITPNPGNDPSGATLSLSTLSVGYSRDFVNSFIGDYFQRDRGYLNLTHFFGGRFLAVLEGGVSSLRYPEVLFADGGRRSNPFSNYQIDASLFGEYRAADSLGINASLRYTDLLSNTELPNAPGTTNGDELKWRRFEAYLGVRWFM